MTTNIIQKSMLDKLPDRVTSNIDFTSWANALYNGTKYAEPTPDYLQRLLVRQVLEAPTPEAVFNQTGIMGLQEALPNVPGATTGPVEITDVYVTESDYTDGAPCYCIIDMVSLDSGETMKRTTGATGLQAMILRLLAFGVWPIKCKIVRLDRKDKGDKYLFTLFPVD